MISPALIAPLSLLSSESVLWSYLPPHEWASHQQWTIINSWFSFKFPVERGILPCLGLRNVCYKFPRVSVWWDQCWYDYTHWPRVSLREQLALTLTASPSPDLSRFPVLDHTTHTSTPPLDSEKPQSQSNAREGWFLSPLCCLCLASLINEDELINWSYKDCTTGRPIPSHVSLSSCLSLSLDSLHNNTIHYGYKKYCQSKLQLLADNLEEKLII